MHAAGNRAVLEREGDALVTVDGVSCERLHLWAVAHARRTAAGATACSIACGVYLNHSAHDGRSMTPILRALEKLGLVRAERGTHVRWQLSERGARVLGDWAPLESNWAPFRVRPTTHSGSGRGAAREQLRSRSAAAAAASEHAIGTGWMIRYARATR